MSSFSTASRLILVGQTRVNRDRLDVTETFSWCLAVGEDASSPADTGKRVAYLVARLAASCPAAVKRSVFLRCCTFSLNSVYTRSSSSLVVSTRSRCKRSRSATMPAMIPAASAYRARFLSMTANTGTLQHVTIQAENNALEIGSRKCALYRSIQARSKFTVKNYFCG